MGALRGEGRGVVQIGARIPEVGRFGGLGASRGEGCRGNDGTAVCRRGLGELPAEGPRGGSGVADAGERGVGEFVVVVVVVEKGG